MRTNYDGLNGVQRSSFRIVWCEGEGCESIRYTGYISSHKRKIKNITIYTFLENL